VLITTNIRVAISEQAVYDYSVKNYGAAEAAGIPEDELIRANAVIADYLRNDSERPLSITVRDDQDRTVALFSPKETAHMADVQDLVQTMFSVHVLALAVLLTCAVVMLIAWSARALAAALLYGSLLTLGVLLMAGLVAASGFDGAWNQFHHIAFTNDLWQLDPDTDHLIQMFPEEFWFDVTSLIVAATIAQATLLAGLSGLYLFLSRERADHVVKPQPQIAGPAGHPRTQPRLGPPDPRHYVR
jgi:integral membrane protein (TIGR01906 family)